MKKQKILIICDYLPDEMNSVAQILDNFLTHFINKAEYVIYKQGFWGRLVKKNNRGIETYYVKESNENVFLRCMDIIRKLLHSNCLVQIIRLSKIIIKEKPNKVVFFIFTPNKTYSKICRMIPLGKGTEYYNILYDTYIGCPSVNFETAKKIEKYVIDQSQGYFVPEFFFAEYTKIYKSDKIFSYELPLLIHKKAVINAYSDCYNRFEFGYFGQIQEFRNKEKINLLFEKLNWRLKVFSEKDDINCSQFDFMGGVIKEALYKCVAQSEFLVIFDNNEPFAHYLPSKVYLYVSFTKPIIVFGEKQIISYYDVLERISGLVLSRH